MSTDTIRGRTDVIFSATLYIDSSMKFWWSWLSPHAQ